MPLSDLQALVADKIRDVAAEISADERGRAIESGVVRYSQDRPRRFTDPVVTAAATHLALPSDWDPNFSRLEKVEVAEGDDSRDISAEIRRVLGSDRIQLLESVTIGTELYVTFTLPHVLTEEDDSIPSLDRGAVANWAAAELLDQRAVLKTADIVPTIDADSVDHGSKSGDFARRAKDLRQRYFDHLGIDPKRNVAASAIVDLDRGDQRGYDRLTHPQRRR